MLVLRPGSACWAPAGCWTRTSVGSLRSQPGSPVSQTENAGARWELGTWACCAQLLHSYPVSCAHLLRQREGPEPAHSRTEHRRGLGWVTPLLAQSWGSPRTCTPGLASSGILRQAESTLCPSHAPRMPQGRVGLSPRTPGPGPGLLLSPQARLLSVLLSPWDPGC